MGWAGVAMVHPKCLENVGSMLRSAHAFGADAVYLVAPRHRYRRQSTDTSNATKHVPTWTLGSIDELVSEAEAMDAALVLVEVWGQDIRSINHPERAMYVFGPEDGSLRSEDFPAEALSARIPTLYCLNLAVAGSIALFSRCSNADAR